MKGKYGYLFPKDFKVPAGHLGLDHGGILNWTEKLSSTTPVFAAQLRLTQEILERMGVVPPVATAEQSDVHQEVCIATYTFA